MRMRSERVIQFYQLHGCRFLPPTNVQAESILTALDAAMPKWEQNHPELFYQALELNFPELVRQTRVGT